MNHLSRAAVPASDVRHSSRRPRSISVQDRGERGEREILRRVSSRYRTITHVWADGGYGSPKGGGMETWAATELGVTLDIVTRPPPPEASPSYLGAGSWNAPSAGSPATGASPVTTNASPPPPKT